MITLGGQSGDYRYLKLKATKMKENRVCKVVHQTVTVKLYSRITRSRRSYASNSSLALCFP